MLPSLPKLTDNNIGNDIIHYRKSLLLYNNIYLKQSTNYYNNDIMRNEYISNKNNTTLTKQLTLDIFYGFR